jgi:ISXO2 transposase-like protein
MSVTWTVWRGADPVLNLKKALVVVAAQENGPGIGRVRMRQIIDASAASLMPFVRDTIKPGRLVHTDGWLGYKPLKNKGYKHQVTFLMSLTRPSGLSIINFQVPFFVLPEGFGK